MAISKQKQGYFDSQNKFNRIDGEKFGGCLKQVFNLSAGIVLDWRIRKSDSKLCIIEYYEQGRGYSIYVTD